MKRLVVAGVGMRGDGYPNAENTVALLKGSSQWDVQDKARWLAPEIRLWHLARGPLIRRVKLAFQLLLGGFSQAVKLIATSHADDLVYLPYPAPMTLWWLSFAPMYRRPQCVVDAYISLWDSMFRDRGVGSADGVASRLVRWFEGRALRAATIVLVDTEANRVQMAADFRLLPERVRSMPLVISRTLGLSSLQTRRTCSQRKKVLFVGTLVPLHGIEVVLAAAARLAGDAGIEIRLIGDGQQGALVEAFIHDYAPDNFTWIREWMPLDEVAREVADADVCLGVFGGAGKAARVLPFKLYYALAAGKAIVTQANYSLPAGLPPLPAVLVEVETQNAAVEQVVLAIRSLVENEERRSSLSASALEYFNTYLSSQTIANEWNGLTKWTADGGTIGKF